MALFIFDGSKRDWKDFAAAFNVSVLEANLVTLFGHDISNLWRWRLVGVRRKPRVKAFMVDLGESAVAGFLIVQQVASGGERSIRGSITVQFSSASSGASADGEVSSALDILRAIPGVASAKPVFDDEMLALLSAWLDGGPLAQHLPVLRRVDVQPEPGASIDVHPLQERLEHWPH